MSSMSDILTNAMFIPTMHFDPPYGIWQDKELLSCWHDKEYAVSAARPGAGPAASVCAGSVSSPQHFQQSRAHVATHRRLLAPRPSTIGTTHLRPWHMQPASPPSAPKRKHSLHAALEKMSKRARSNSAPSAALQTTSLRQPTQRTDNLRAPTAATRNVGSSSGNEEHLQSHSPESARPLSDTLSPLPPSHWSVYPEGWPQPVRSENMQTESSYSGNGTHSIPPVHPIFNDGPSNHSFNTANHTAKVAPLMSCPSLHNISQAAERKCLTTLPDGLSEGASLDGTQVSETPLCCGAEQTASTDCSVKYRDSPAAVMKRDCAMHTSSEPDTSTLESSLSAPSLSEVADFIHQVKLALKAQGKWKSANVGRRQARRISELLDLASLPNDSEALFLSTEEAAAQVDSNHYFPGPIITSNQQSLSLQTTTHFLSEFYDDTARVWIQDPSIRLSRNIPHAREISIGQLKQRFLTHKPSIPWNCLEMATHVEDGLRPAFLSNEDCRLLTKLKLPSAADSASRRGYEPGWKEVEKWALLAQGGALTEPHQDSHGYSTYITVNQGTIGFGWLSNPTPAERLAWRADPATYTGGRWRYVVLRPGHTVFFPSGTVHFVFRLRALGDTLAFGGHVLRCSQICKWVECMLEEKAGPDVTNEELSVSAPAYLERVEVFVRQALEGGREAEVQKWGGREGIERFLELKKEFMEPIQVSVRV